MDFLPKILYQDKDLLLIRKPHGIASSRGQEECFLDIIKKYWSDDSLRAHQLQIFWEEWEYGLLNRLDNATAGLLYFARSETSKAQYLSLQAENRITKIYYAQVYGSPRSAFGQISTPIYHYRDDASRMTVDASKGRGKAQEVVTYRELVESEELKVKSLLRITITSGCRHQIRCHLASIGYPVVWDRLYMSKKMRKEKKEWIQEIEKIELVSAGLPDARQVLNYKWYVAWQIDRW